MKEQKIKPLTFVDAFIDYFVRRAKRVLKLKVTEYDHPSLDVHPDTGTVWVWFHTPDKIVGWAQFHFDGQCYEKTDYRPVEKKGK